VLLRRATQPAPAHRGDLFPFLRELVPDVCVQDLIPDLPGLRVEHRRDEHEVAEGPWMPERIGLGDHAAVRVAEQVDPGEAERLPERREVVDLAVEGVVVGGLGALRSAGPEGVEIDDAPIAGER
jgi:hypothetical protein